MTETSQLDFPNQWEDDGTSHPVETGSLEVSSKKWVAQIETTPVPAAIVPAFPLPQSSQPHRKRLFASQGEIRPLTHQPSDKITEAVTAKQTVVPHEETELVVSELSTVPMKAVVSELPTVPMKAVISELPTVLLKAMESQRGEEKVEEEEGSFTFLQGKRFTFKGMSSTQRLISGLAIGFLLVSALLILFNLFPHTFTQLSTLAGGKAIGISTIVFVAVLLFYLLSWSFLLAGALHGHILIRIVVLSIFTFVQMLTAIISPFDPLILFLGSLCLTGILWLWGLIIFLLELRAALKQQEQEDAHVQPEVVAEPDRILAFLPILTLLFVYYALLLGFFLRFGSDTPQANLALFNKLISVNMMAMTVLLLPVLFLVGTDFAGLGAAIVRGGATLLSRMQGGTPWLLALITALVATYLAFQDLPDRTLNTGNWLISLCSQLAVGAGIIALLSGVVYLAGLQRWPFLRVKMRILILAMFSILLLGVIIPQVAITLYTDTRYPISPVDAVNFSVYKQSNVVPYFSLAYPSDWPVTVRVNNPALTAIVFLDTESNTPGYFIVARSVPGSGQQASPLLQLKTFLFAFCDNCSFNPQQTTSQGPWQLIRYQEDNKDGIAWIGDDNGQSLILTGIADPSDMTYDEPIFTAMVNSWSPDLHATVPPPDNTLNQEQQIISSRAVPFTAGLIPLFIGLLALPLLLWRRKRPGLIATGALFFMVMGILQCAYYLQALIAPHMPRVHLDFQLSGVLLTASVGTLLVLCWLLIKRKITRENTHLLTFLLVLNGSLWFVSFMYWLYGQATNNGLNQTVWITLQALLLVVAFGWEICTSGKHTNKGSASFPRSVRLLLFLGYSMLVTTCVLYFFSQVSLPRGVLLPPDQLFFGGENWLQIGLLRLGVPLIITTFMLQVTYWWGTRHREAGGEKALPETEAAVQRCVDSH